MKALFLLTILVGSVLAGPSIVRHPLHPMSIGKPVKAPGIDLCNLCIQFSSQFLNELVNIIANAGVIGGCADLCELLEEEVKVNSSLVEVVCDLLCDYVGIEAFIKLIDKADLDPIYYCELLKLCPINDNGDAKITSLTVSPPNVPKGSTFHINMQFQTMNGTGTGEIDLLIDTADGIPVGQNQLIEPLQAGMYNVTWNVDAKRDPNCDPTQQICETWEVGAYKANVAICNGECGSKHPHSQLYDNSTVSFNVVKG